tara:strand:- start:149 stop:454 length:306 start_codon:yes stop_codon:yes gene_type:complete
MTDFMQDFEQVAREVGQQLKFKGAASINDVEKLKLFLEIYLAKEESRGAKIDRSGRLNKKKCLVCKGAMRKKRLKYCSEACKKENKRLRHESAKRGREMCS